MYTLNPSLNNREEIKSKKRLNLPDFPDLDQSLTGDLLAGNEKSTALDLDRQVTRFEISKLNLERVAAELSSNASVQNVVRITAIVNQLKQEVNTSGWGSDGTTTIIHQMVFDLFSIYNQTLSQVIADKNADASQVTLMQNIADNLAELVGDVKALSRNGLASSEWISSDLRDNQNYLASIGEPEFLAIGSSEFKTSTGTSISAAAGLLKEFAFAVYKYSDAGELITKGPEVEGKYKVKYVLPALKDIPNAYHPLRDPATYAVASLPPAKIFIVVEDFSGNQVSIQDPLIDFKVVFNNPQLGDQDRKIVVPLYITR
ncbi:hypothetical protein [Algoriphagus jejuensis]